MAHGFAGSGHSVSLSIVGPAISAAGNSAGVGTVVFSNSNGVTFGMAGSTVTASVAPGGGGLTNVNLSAGTTSQNLSAFVFSNSNNVSFGLNGSTVTATVTVATSLSNIRVSAGTTSNLLSAITFNNGGGITFGLDSSTITASHDGLTSQSNQAFSAVGGSSAFQTLSFSNANGASFSNNAGQVQLSYTRPVVSNAIQSVGSATNSGTNTSRFAADDHVHAGVFSMGVSTAGNTSGDTRVDVGRYVLQGGNNVTLSQITAANGLNTIVFSGPNAGGAQTGISGVQVSDTTYTSGTVSWRNANGISFGSSGANGVSASYTVPTVTNSSLTLSDNATSITAARLAFTNLNGVTLSLSTTTGGSATLVGSHNGLTIQSNLAFSAVGGSSTFQTLGFSNNGLVSWTNTNGSVAIVGVRASFFAVSNTTQSTSGAHGLGALSFAGAGGASVGISNGSVVISAAAAGGAQTGISGIQVSDTTYTSGTVTWQNANGISFGSSGANGVSASYTVPVVTNSSWTVSDNATSITVARLAFTNLNGVTLSLSTTTGGSATVVGSHNGLTSQSNQAFSAAGGSSAFQTLIFTNSNGISFSNTNGSVWGSHNGLTSQSNQAFSAAGGSSAFQTLGFSDNGAASFTNTNGSVAIASVRASLFAVSNTTQSSSGTQNLGAISFAGAGGVSVGVSNGSIVVSGGAGGGDGGNVLAAGTRTATSLGTVLFSNSNGVTFGLDTTAGSVMTASVYAPVTNTSWSPFAYRELFQNNAGQGIINIAPTEVPHVEFDRINMLAQLTNASNSSGSHTLSLRFAVYTRTSNSLSLLHSAQGTYAMTQSGTLGSYSLYSGLRIYTIGLTQTLTAGMYYFAMNSNTTSGGANATLNAFGVTNIGSNFIGPWSSSNASTQHLNLGLGVYSVSSTAFPASMAFSQIHGSGNQALRPPYFALHSSTV